LAALARPGLASTPVLIGQKPPVYVLPHRSASLWRLPDLTRQAMMETHGTAPSRPAPLNRHRSSTDQSLEVRTVAGSPPEPIFTRLCRCFGL